MAEGWPEDQLSSDEFLGGQLRICQPRQGYRAGIDPVLLAASIPARSGDTVLELGCGAGTALFCLARRVPGLTLTGIELQPAYANLARRNAARNGLTAEIVTADLADLPTNVTRRQFTHVMANPPYYDRKAGPSAADPGRETALGEGVPLAAWVAMAAKRTAPRGYATFIHMADRLPDLLHAAVAHLGSLEVLPLIPRPGRAARRFLLRGRKGGRGAFRLHDGWVLHDGPAHPGDRENYTGATARVLRDGAVLPFSS